MISKDIKQYIDEQLYRRMQTAYDIKATDLFVEKINDLVSVHIHRLIAKNAHDIATMKCNETFEHIINSTTFTQRVVEIVVQEISERIGKNRYKI